MTYTYTDTNNAHGYVEIDSLLRYLARKLRAQGVHHSYCASIKCATGSVGRQLSADGREPVKRWFDGESPHPDQLMLPMLAYEPQPVISVNLRHHCIWELVCEVDGEALQFNLDTAHPEAGENPIIAMQLVTRHEESPRETPRPFAPRDWWSNSDRTPVMNFGASTWAQQQRPSGQPVPPSGNSEPPAVQPAPLSTHRPDDCSEVPGPSPSSSRPPCTTPPRPSGSPPVQPSEGSYWYDPETRRATVRHPDLPPALTSLLMQHERELMGALQRATGMSQLVLNAQTGVVWSLPSTNVARVLDEYSEHTEPELSGRSVHFHTVKVLIRGMDTPMEFHIQERHRLGMIND